MNLPDFLIIGAMKCGTTTLQAQLAAQPGIFMTEPKEPNFFSDDAIYSRGLDWYQSLFDQAAPGDLKGEASTHYTKLPTYPQTLTRLRPVLNTPRLIYMIRNPLTRTVSHYIHEWSQGVISDGLDEALMSHPELVAYSRYAEQIAPWAETFGAENILLLSLEEMKADPEGVLARTAAFIGYKGQVQWRANRAQENVSSERVRRLPLHDLLVDNPVATVLRRTLVPKVIRDLIRASRQMRERPELTTVRRNALEEEFAVDHAWLAQLFPDAPGLAAAYPFVAT